ncbi:MAG TPA: PEP-CTERM sorting domain-containing protein, partial [Tepidisphaeraceae bacterium]|nr:PEP-CTERM sorting domain-containing protein [Tepidisphaeraceae bacterium]
GTVTIEDGVRMGSAITAVTQDSTSSTLIIRGGAGGTTTYSGITTVSAGQLQLASGHEGLASSSEFMIGDTAADGHGTTANSTFNVNYDSNAGLTLGAGQILTGFGTVSGHAVTLTTGATLKPGNGTSTGGLEFTNSGLSISGGNLDYYLNTPTSSALAGTVALTIGQSETLMVDAGPSFGDGTYYLLDSVGAITNNSSSFSGWTADLPAGYSGSFVIGTDPNNSSAHSVELIVAGTAVPEPASLALMCLGSCGLLWRKSRRRIV